MTQLTKPEIHRLLHLLNEELAASRTTGELYLVGGAVMCLAFDARESTRDVDGFFKPTREIREAAARVGVRMDLPPTWLNDAVKGFLSSRGDFRSFLDLSNLRVFIAEPHYLLAMKCMAMRLGAEFHDLDDVRYLLRFLNIGTSNEALEIVLRYFTENQISPKTRFALEELLHAGEGR